MNDKEIPGWFLFAVLALLVGIIYVIMHLDTTIAESANTLDNDLNPLQISTSTIDENPF